MACKLKSRSKVLEQTFLFVFANYSTFFFRAAGYGNSTDWTTMDPAIVSYRQFPTYNNYGSAFEQNEFHPNMAGLGGNSHMNDFHFNPQPQQNMGLGEIFLMLFIFAEWL